MIVIEDRFKSYLKSKGLKFTPERDAILKEIFSFHGHFNVDGLYERLLRHNKNISRATIYRTLPLLLENGLVEETFHCQDKSNYEHIFGHKHHDHMLCIGCGKVVGFREEEMEKLQEMVCKKYDFYSIEHKLEIKGYCKECYKKFKNNKA